MNITQKMGGIDLLSSILASFMSEKTAAPLMGFTGGLMSWFSSANGVVFPTLIPTVPEIAAPVSYTHLVPEVNVRVPEANLQITRNSNPEYQRRKRNCTKVKSIKRKISRFFA